MFVYTIILGLSLYPGHCYKANDAINTRRQARNSRLHYNNANYQPSQDIYFNYEPSQNNNYNYAPRENSNYNYATSQNSNHNYAPSQNSNNNYAPRENSNYNYEPSQNSNNNYAPSQDINSNNEPKLNSYGNVTYVGAGLYRAQRIPNDGLVDLTKIIISQPYNNGRYSSQLDQLSRDYQTVNRYRYPIAYKAEIGGTPVPMFREYPYYRQSDELSHNHQTISNIDRYHPVPHTADIGAKPVPMFREYPKFRFVLPPVNVTYPELPSTPIPFPPIENSQKGGEFPDIESRKNSMMTAASPEELGFDDDPDYPVMVEQELFQWQVSVFSKEVSPHVRVCGGSLVTSSVVISAARCFWSVGPLSADLFAAGAGEAASGQANNYEAYQYQINVRDIRLPPRFRGGASNYQDDIAVVVLARPLPPALKPVCVSFDWEQEEQQLAEGNEGMVNTVPTVKSMRVLDRKIEGWNLDMRNQRVPYIGVEECLREAHEDQLRYVTSDKFCAGFRGIKDRAFSPDTGSGLVYFQDSPSIPFLRGVVSLPLGGSCVTAFTHVGTHRAFLLRHVSGLEAGCARHYPGAGGAVNAGGGEDFVCNCYC